MPAPTLAAFKTSTSADGSTVTSGTIPTVLIEGKEAAVLGSVLGGPSTSIDSLVSSKVKVRGIFAARLGSLTNLSSAIITGAAKVKIG